MSFKLTPSEARSAWVKALRSGKYTQAKKFLAVRYGNSTSFCCLGVACELFIEIEGKKILDREYTKYRGINCIDYYSKINHYDSGNISGLPLVVMKWLGLQDWLGNVIGIRSLSKMNDTGVNFDDIATFIESEPEGLLASPENV